MELWKTIQRTWLNLRSVSLQKILAENTCIFFAGGTDSFVPDVEDGRSGR
jgi:hypothetical protein